MLRIRTSAALTTGLLASILVATPATGQEIDPVEPNPTATVDPTSGAAGAEVTVRGSGCKHQDNGTLGQMTFGFQVGLDEIDSPLIVVVDGRVGPTGAWVSTVAVPERIRVNGQLTDTPPGDNYSITAICVFRELPSHEWISYDAVPFEVTAGPENVLAPGGSGAAAPAPGDSSSLPGTETGSSTGTGTSASTPSPAVPIPGRPRTTG